MSDADAGDSPGRGGRDDAILSVERINTFYGRSHVLHDVSFEIADSEVVTLLGRNGAGKTTTLRSITGLTPPRSGSIRYDGEAIQGREPHEIRRMGIAWVPEDRRIFPMLTVEENLRLAAHHGGDDGDFEGVYSRFGRLAERRDQKAGTLSGGEQQMLAMARSMVGLETDLLLLDEPSEGLAPRIVEDVADIVRDLNGEGVTVLLVEQNAQMALSLADRAYVIDKGQITFDGDADELRENRELMEEHLGVH